MGEKFMAAYIVVVRSNTRDPSGLEKYASIAREAPIDKLQIVAAKTNRWQVLEGPAADALAILRFPTWDDALAWYNSDAYSKARPYRQAASDCRAFIIEGV
jgi:uncharacterized protein (DUF1330 family)